MWNAIPKLNQLGLKLQSTSNKIYCRFSTIFFVNIFSEIPFRGFYEEVDRKGYAFDLISAFCTK